MSFKFRWVPFFATLCVVTLGIVLGQWQTSRAQYKEALATQLHTRQTLPPISLGADIVQSADATYRSMRVQGEFVKEWPVYLDNRPYQGRPGVYVLMPFKILHTQTYVLVARGWMPLQSRTTKIVLNTPEGIQTIEGVAQPGMGRVFELGVQTNLAPQALVQNIDVNALAQATKFFMQPFVLLQLQGVSDGLVRDWPQPSDGVDMHRGYAFQWYALACMACLFFIVTGCRRETK